MSALDWIGERTRPFPWQEVRQMSDYGTVTRSQLRWSSMATSGAKRPFKRNQRRVTDRISIRSQSSLIGFGDNGVSLTDMVIWAKAYQLAKSL
jgi:hypothetical protein